MRHVDWLPDCYRKAPSSNNSRLLSLNEAATEELRRDIKEVWNALDLSQATGKSLDLYGATLSQLRGPMTDEQYRYLLFAQIGKNRVGGDYPSIVRALMMMFGEQWEAAAGADFELAEDDRPCLVRLVNYPEGLEEAGFTVRQIAQMIKGMLPIGITLLLQFYSRVEVPIRYANAIRIRTQFHPRYNLAYLRLDGSWQLDGTRQLNGYDSGNTLDFYPVGLRMQSGCSVAARVDPKVRIGMTAAEDVGSAEQLGIRAEAVAEPREEPRLKITSVVAQGIDTAQRLRITGETPAEIQTEPAIRLPATVTQEIRTGEQLRVVTNTAVGVMAGAAQHTVLQSRQEIRTGETVCVREEAAESVQSEEQLQVRVGVGYQIETAGYMTKLNVMDGNWKLEGSRKLDGGRYIL